MNTRIFIVLFCYILIPTYASIFSSEGENNFKLYCAGCHSVERKTIFSNDQWNIERPTQVQAEKWFGRQPPELTNVANTRGAEWIKAYLLGFYPDPQSKTGSNNKIFEGTLMPNILGERFKNYTMSEKKQFVTSIILFLQEVADPSRYKRQVMAILILPIMLLLWLLMFLLNRIVWQDYKKNST